MKAALLSCVLLLAFSARADTINTLAASGTFQTPYQQLPFSIGFNWDITTDSLVANTMQATPYALASVSGRDLHWDSPDWVPLQSGTEIQLTNCNVFCGPSRDWSVPGSYPLNDYMLVYHDPSSGGQDTIYGFAGTFTVTDPPPAETPEPASASLFLLGLPVLGLLRRYSRFGGSSAEQAG